MMQFGEAQIAGTDDILNHCVAVKSFRVREGDRACQEESEL